MKFKKRTRKSLSIILVFLIGLVSISFAQVKNSELIIGKWLFVKFEFPKNVPPDDEIVLAANKKFKDVIYNFTKDKKFIMEQKNSSNGFNKQTTYVFEGDKYVKLAVGQVIRIEYLDANNLRIHVEGFDPIGIFKRTK